MFLVVGLAIDGARGYYTAGKTMSVLDSAALAAARAMSERDLTDDQVRDIVTRYINAHMLSESGRGITNLPAEVTIDRETDTVSVAMTSHVRNYIAVLAGYPQFEVNSAVAASFGQKDIELGMMLDVSGSMSDFDKIGTLRTAARSLVDRLIPAAPDARNSVRIGIAPYSSSINVSSIADRVKETPGRGRPEDKCVTERRGRAAYTDDSPGRGNPFPGRASWCPDSQVVPITNDKAALYAEIDGFDADGSTAGHLGIAWAWYLVSPEWSDIWPAQSQPRPYTDRRTMKAVILMTDGMFNTRYESGNGSSAEQAAQLCANIKDKGVMIYTIGYEAPAEVLPLLRACASTPGQFYDAGNAAELMNAFDKIASHLTELRLSR